jgi:hypothetical protein
MKKLWIILFVLVPTAMFAQVGFRLDGGLGAALTFGGLKSYGIAAFTEPKVTIGPSITAGVRFEGDALFGGKIFADAEDVEVGMSTRAAILLRGEYFIGQSKTRPFIGVGLGSYTIANTSASSSGMASIQASRNFGFAPELGIAFGHFKLSAMYHIVGGSTLVDMGVGDLQEISNSYLGILMSFRIFGIKDKENE